MKLLKPMLTLLLSSALWVPVALAQSDNAAGTAPSNASSATSTNQPGANNSGTTAQPGNATQPQTNTNPSQKNGANGDAGTGASAPANTGNSASSSATMGDWTGKAVTGADGKKLGTVSGAAADKVTLDTRYGSVELASALVVADESGNLAAATTSTADVKAMVKTQAGDSSGAAAASKPQKRHKAKQPGTEPTPSANQTPEEQAPAGQAPAGPTPEQAPAGNTTEQPPANQTTPPPSPPPH